MITIFDFPVELYHRITGECLATNVSLANTSWKRLRGLIGRKSLNSGEALWIRPCNGVHTFFMLFAIDVIFLDQELRIVKLIENFRPFRICLPCLKAKTVIELPPHTISKNNLQIGTLLRIVK